MGSHPVILNGKGAAAVMVAAWASWVPTVSVVWLLVKVGHALPLIQLTILGSKFLYNTVPRTEY